jgi:signal transduction histidine kinase
MAAVRTDVTAHCAATDAATLTRLAEGLADARLALTRQWLERVQLLPASDATHCSHHLLEQIPELIQAVAHLLQSGAGALKAGTGVQKVAELGELPSSPPASMHQSLLEYQVLADVLEEFLEREIGLMADVGPSAAVQAMRRLSVAVRAVHQQIVEDFVAHHAAAIERQMRQFRELSQLVTHDIRQPLAVLQVVSKTLSGSTGELDAVRIMDIFERSIARLADATGKLERLASSAAR